MNAPLAPVFQYLGEGFTRHSPALASLLVASVWRGVVLAALVALCLRMLPKLSAAVRSVIWFCVLAGVVLSPALPLLTEHEANSGASGLLRVDPRWSYGLIAVWVTFSVLRMAQLAMSAWQLRGLAQRSTPVASSACIRQILNHSRRRVQLCTSGEIDRPSVVGFTHPRILLPPVLLAQLSEPELEQIVLHEMEHLRRHDDWTNLLQKLSVALLPLHPVVVWLDRRLCLERELACDDGVVRATHARKSYAACLTNLAERSLVQRGLSLALSAVGAVENWKPQSQIAKRVYRILSKPETVMGRTQTRIAGGMLLAGTLCGAVVLAHTPHLISFAPEVETSAMSASPAPAESSIVLPNSHFVATKALMPTAHAVLANAITIRGSALPATAAPLRTTPRRPMLRRVHQHRSVQQPELRSPMFRLAAWHEEDLPAPRFVLAVQTDSQFMYAAVPMRGGWLFVQL